MNKLIDRDKIYKVIKVNKKSIKMLFILTVVAFLWAFFFSSRETTYNLFVWENWDNFITVLTFIVAITIGWLDYVRYWRENLPNKLTVHFVYERPKKQENNETEEESLIQEGYVMSCYTASLVSKSDIRPWAQQIGSQMGSDRNLHFELTNSQKYLGIIDNQFKHYEVTYYLFEEPKIFEQKDFKNKYITWVIEDNDNESKGDIRKKIHDRQANMPLSREDAKTGGEDEPIRLPLT